MIEPVAVEHRGYRITWSDNQDHWHCDEIEYSSKSLLAVKAKIDAVERKAKRTLALPALYLSYHDQHKPCVVVTVDEDKDRCWITTDQQGEDRWGRPVEGKLKREKVALDRLVADTPDNRAALDALESLRQAALAAQRAQSEASKAIPRLTREQALGAGADESTKAEERGQ